MAGFCAVLYFGTAVGGFLGELPISHCRDLLHLIERGATKEDRLRAWIGSEYNFVEFVRKQTPDDAVILMSDQFAPSLLNPLQTKNQAWASYFLYPRKILFLHQRNSPLFEQARWLLVDDIKAVSWIAPSHALSYIPGRLGCFPFDMGAYMEAIRAGDISRVYLPPGRPSRAPKQAWPEAER